MVKIPFIQLSLCSSCRGKKRLVDKLATSVANGVLGTLETLGGGGNNNLSMLSSQLLAQNMFAKSKHAKFHAKFRAWGTRLVEIEK